jgi:hypothetical protein
MEHWVRVKALEPLRREQYAPLKAFHLGEEVFLLVVVNRRHITYGTDRILNRLFLASEIEH